MYSCGWADGGFTATTEVSDACGKERQQEVKPENESHKITCKQKHLIPQKSGILHFLWIKNEAPSTITKKVSSQFTFKIALEFFVFVNMFVFGL